MSFLKPETMVPHSTQVIVTCNAIRGPISKTATTMVTVNAKTTATRCVPSKASQPSPSIQASPPYPLPQQRRRPRPSAIGAGRLWRQPTSAMMLLSLLCLRFGVFGFRNPVTYGYDRHVTSSEPSYRWCDDEDIGFKMVVPYVCQTICLNWCIVMVDLEIIIYGGTGHVVYSRCYGVA